MCEQCLTKAEVLKSDILPGFHLMVARGGSEAWPKGFYALVECNDPLFVFEGPIMESPVKGLTEDDLDVMPEYPEGYEEYIEGAQRLDRAMRLHPEVGHRLMKACYAKGYSQSEHGPLGFWFLDFLALGMLEGAATRADTSGENN